MSLAFPPSELIINEDGSIYHLNLRPEQLAHDIITVGDPDRVEAVAKHLDNKEFDIQRREFRTITGSKDGKRWSIISTGIGTDNIDIVFNELDALANIDFETRRIRHNHTQLRFYRLGTSGTLQKNISVDSYVASALAVGLGGLLMYYKEGVHHIDHPFSKKVNKCLQKSGIEVPVYTCEADEELIKQLGPEFLSGITYTAPGFYGPQGRSLRLSSKSSQYLEDLAELSFDHIPSTNLEMETAGIYGMAKMLDHQALSISLILANRVTGEFSTKAEKSMDKLIQTFFSTFGPTS